MKKGRKIMAISIAICLLCLSTNAIFATSDSLNVSAQNIEGLVKVYKNQNKDVIVIDGNKVTKLERAADENVEIAGLTEDQKVNSDVYLIENDKDGYRTCYIEVPVSKENSSDIIPMASGSKSESKNYARINAYVTLYYDKYTKNNTGYKPTKVGGRISYLPN